MKSSLHIIKRFVISIMTLFVAVNLFAQQYPVRINAFLIPPYSVKLSELAYTGENKLQVQLLMTDMQQTSVR
ncbi:MAG: hypothetical protein LBS01_07975, partial [Prevotellaceae bacterium]|nr:hypothetical protein [Prevotellaceae bacterium]